MPRIVVHGTGSIGLRHLGVLRALPDVEVVGLPTRAGRADELRRLGHGAVEDMSQALAQRPDAVVVATDTGRHVADAEAWLEAGCDVLVEKPLATTASQALRLQRKARATNRSLRVACCLRFDAGISFIRSRLASLGRLRMLDAECLSWLPDWRPGRDHRSSYSVRPGEGGVLLDLIHEIDLACWFGGAPERVHASLSSSSALDLPGPAEDSAWLTLERAAGPAGTVRLSYATRPASRRFRLWGDLGSAEWDPMARRAWSRLHGDDRSYEEVSWADPGAMYAAQAARWLECLRGDATPELATADDGVLALAVCDAARASAQSGRTELVSVAPT